MTETTTHRRSASIRWRLALTYAGIALLTAAVLGGILVSVLASYYGRSENAYLEAAAERTSRLMVGPGAGMALGTQRELQIAALATQTRVRLYDQSGLLIGDSGSPLDIDVSALAPRDLGNRGPAGDGRPLPAPLGSGIFGGEASADAPRSRRTFEYPLTGPGGAALGTLVLSEAPVAGYDVLLGVAQALGLAALVAIALAAVAGYVLSARITAPLVELTDTSDRMAEGDLGARAQIERDDEVGRLASSFNAMAGRIEVTVTALRRFVADAAHEIGTPLTALQADLELAEAESTTDDERRLVRRALAQARRLEDLSGNLLRLSRLESGEAPPAAAAVDASALMGSVAAAIASRAEQSGISLQLQLAAESLVVRVDAGALEAALSNLADNAVKFTPEGGTVTMGTAREDSGALLWVEDSGIGIPAEEQADVFGRFYRARNVSAYPGSGLGLAIVQATVEAAGGTVGFGSSEAGTRFEVRLPVAERLNIDGR